MEKKKRHKRFRFIPNEYDLNKIDFSSAKNEILKQIKNLESLLEENFPPNVSKRIDSLGKKKTNTSFYTGTGGNIYLYWKQYLFYGKKKESLENFKQALETNLSITKLIGEKDTNSFFMGDSGIYLFACIYGIETKNYDFVNESFTKLIDLKSLSFSSDSDLELLYGTAGYLYSLLFFKNYLINEKLESQFQDKVKILNDTIKSIFELLLKQGNFYSKKYKWSNSLLYPWPLNSSHGPSLYLGAAHGLIGVLYILLCATKFFPEILTKENSSLFISNLKYIQSLQFETGNFPSDVVGNDDGDKVHFCHGCVGALHLFLLGENLFPGNNFDKTAFLINKCLWERGLLYKGNGVCHGMSGITYALIKLFKNTGKEIYLKEAVGICFGTFDKKIQALCSEYEDPQRKRKGMPDTPYSLMEGDGGTLCMYYDLIMTLNKTDNYLVGLFPGYEIF